MYSPFGWAYRAWSYRNYLPTTQIGPMIAEGNFHTRNFRQKPVVGLTNYRDKVKSIRMYKKSKPKPKPSIGGKTVNLSIGGGKLKTTTYKSSGSSPQNKILNKSMAFRRRSYRPRRRLRRRLRAVRRRRRLTAIKNMPNSMVRKLSTVFRTSIDPAANSGLTAQVFQLNSAYDVTGTVSAQQPLYFDQIMGLYQKYCVIGYKFTAELVSTDNTNPITVGFTPMTTDTPLTSGTYYLEAKGTTHTLLTGDLDRSTIRHKSGVKKWLLPRGGKLLTEANYSGTATTNPTTMLYGHLWCEALHNSGVDPSAIDYLIKIEQVIVFYDPILPARS